MIKETVTIDQVLELLNEMLAIDPEAVQNLVNSRVKCNEALSNHPTIQVRQYEDDEYPQVGIIGVVNGFFGIDDVSGMGAICCHDDGSGKILKFARVS